MPGNSNSTFDLTSDKPPRLSIKNNDLVEVVNINLETGHVTLAQGFAPDDAAKTFWDAVIAMFPNGRY